MSDYNTYYQILESQIGASLEDVKRSYRDLVKVWHPDRFGNDLKLQIKAQEKLKQINHAYEQLCIYLVSASAVTNPAPKIQRNPPVTSSPVSRFPHLAPREGRKGTLAILFNRFALNGKIVQVFNGPEFSTVGDATLRRGKWSPDGIEVNNVFASDAARMIVYDIYCKRPEMISRLSTNLNLFEKAKASGLSFEEYCIEAGADSLISRIETNSFGSFEAAKHTLKFHSGSNDLSVVNYIMGNELFFGTHKSTGTVTSVPQFGSAGIGDKFQQSVCRI